MPYVYNPDPDVCNYEIDVERFEEMVGEDVRNGLVPFWFGASYGTTHSVAIDITPRIVALCLKHKIWINLDAAFLGSTWICP